jgi:hypothetical protein
MQASTLIGSKMSSAVAVAVAVNDHVNVNVNVERQRSSRHIVQGPERSPR